MGFNYLISLFFIYQYSSRLETSTFSGKPADYVFCLFFLWICNIIGGSILSLYVSRENVPLVSTGSSSLCSGTDGRDDSERHVHLVSIE